ncbi:hypothetical protein AB1Y20_011931 [Prymnesium parvum]|uniref:Leucine-rich repeat and WD repeat-containing protein 1 n=1 Tax=Prymnesium parvum TaxID=97485 RepID=A0AB34IQ90_PRYPA
MTSAVGLLSEKQRSESHRDDAEQEADTIQPPSGDAIRVLQWNILADGLANDGFLAATDSEELAKEMEAAKGDAAKLEAFQQNLEQVPIDWERRWERMQEIIRRNDPSIITLQELDRMCSVQKDMLGLGYVCTYLNQPPPKYHSLEHEQRNTPKYFEDLYRSGIAFAPKSPSNAKTFGGENADNDGCAVFWKERDFKSTRIDFVGVDGKRNEGCVRVELERKSDARRLYVICAHLHSGSEPTDECKRLSEICEYTLTPAGAKTGPSLLKWFDQSQREHPTLFCLGANSEPTRGDEQTVWRAMHKAGLMSVWDEYCDREGHPLRFRARDAEGEEALDNLQGLLAKLQKRPEGAVAEGARMAAELVAALAKVNRLKREQQRLQELEAALTKVDRLKREQELLEGGVAEERQLADKLEKALEEVERLEGGREGAVAERARLAAELAAARKEVDLLEREQQRLEAAVADRMRLAAELEGALEEVIRLEREQEQPESSVEERKQVTAEKKVAALAEVNRLEREQDRLKTEQEGLAAVVAKKGRLAAELEEALAKADGKHLDAELEKAQAEVNLLKEQELPEGALALAEKLEEALKKVNRLEREGKVVRVVTVTTNKMRGPQSKQPKKRGKHVLGVVDHIYYSGGMEFMQHVAAPLEFERSEAKRHLLPSLEMPSDHVPVIVDFNLPNRASGKFTLTGFPRLEAHLHDCAAMGALLLQWRDIEGYKRLWDQDELDQHDIVEDQQYDVAELKDALQPPLLNNPESAKVACLASIPSGQSAVAVTWRDKKLHHVFYDKEVELTLVQMPKDDKVLFVLLRPQSNDIVIVSNGTTVALWSPNKAKPHWIKQVEHEVSCIACAEDFEQRWHLALATKSKKVDEYMLFSFDLDATTSPNVKTVAEHHREVNALAIKSGKLASGGKSKVVALHDTTDSTLSAKISTAEMRHDGSVLVLCFHNDDVLASGAKDCKVKVWDIAKMELLRVLEHDSSVTALAFSPDGSLFASGTEDRTVQLWSDDTMMRVLDVGLHDKQVADLAFCSSSRFLFSTGEDGKVLKTRVLRDGDATFDLKPHPEAHRKPEVKKSPSVMNAQLSDWKVRSISFMDGAELVAVSTLDKNVHVAWQGVRQELNYVSEECTLRSTGDSVHLAIYGKEDKDPQQETAALYYFKFSKEETDKTPRLSFPTKSASASCLAFSPDCTLLAVGSNKDVEVWTLGESDKSQKRSQHFSCEDVRAMTFAPQSMTFAPQSYKLAIAHGNKVSLFEDERAKASIDHKASVLAVAFNADGQLVASASKDRRLKISRVDSLELSLELLHEILHDAVVCTLAFGSDLLASAGFGGHVHLHDIRSGELVRTLEFSGVVRAAAFSSDARFLAIGGDHHEIQSCELHPSDDVLKLWIRSPIAPLLPLSRVLRADFVRWLLWLSSPSGRTLVTHAVLQGDLSVLMLSELPGVSVLRRDANGKHALDYALELQHSTMIAALLPHVMRTVPPNARVELVTFLVKLARVYPELVAPALELELYRPYDGAPSFKRVARSMLKYGTIALKGDDSDKPREGFWKCDEVGAEVDVHCAVVGLPSLLAGREGVFRAFTQTEHSRILTSDAMHAVITFKWETYGRSIWHLQVTMFALFFLCQELALVLVVHSKIRAPGLVLFMISFAISLHYLIEEILEFKQARFSLYRHFFTSSQNIMDAAQVIVQGFLFVGLLMGLPYTNSLGAVGSLLMLPKAGAVTRGSEQLSFTVFVLRSILSDMISFTVVVVYVLLVSTVAFLLLLETNGAQDYGSIGIGTFTTFRLLLGDFDPEIYVDGQNVTLATAVFVITMFFVNIVLLNMLIALMTDTWTKLQSERRFLGLQGRAQLLNEFEARMSEKALERTDWFPKWLHVIKEAPTPEHADRTAAALQLQVIVQGRTRMIDAWPTTTAAQLEHIVAKRFNISSFGLYYGGRPLHGATSLSNYGITSGATIELKERGRGGGSSQSKSSAHCPGEAEAASVWKALERSRAGVREVRLVRASWLAARAKAEEPLPPRQVLEANPQTAKAAFLDVDELRALPRGPQGQLPIVAVSHAWLRTYHPDPDAETLRALCARLAREQGEARARRHRRKPLPRELGVFLDWCSLCQTDERGKRTEVEERAFRGALASMELWFAHPLTSVVKVSELPYKRRLGDSFKPYAERGWPAFEGVVATLAKRSSVDCWPMVMDVNPRDEGHHRPPLTVEQLAAKHFTIATDTTLVLELYLRTLTTLRSLQLSGLEWGDADAAQLARVLPLCPRLESLALQGNAFGDEGVRMLATALHEYCPVFEQLSLSGKIGEKGVAALLPLCEARPWLRLVMDGVAFQDDYSLLTHAAASDDTALARHVWPALERGGARRFDTDACGRTARLAAAMAGREAAAAPSAERSSGALVLEVGAGESKLYALVPAAGGVAVHELCKLLGKLGRREVKKLRQALVKKRTAFVGVSFDRSMLSVMGWYRDLEPTEQREWYDLLAEVASQLHAPLAALGAPAMEVHEVAPTMEALYAHAATAHAAARCGLTPPAVALAATESLVHASALDAAFSFAAPLARGEALVEGGDVDYWRHEVALEYNMTPSPLKEYLLREAGREGKPLHVALLSGFCDAACAAGLKEGVYLDVEEVRRATPPTAAKDIASWNRLLAVLWLLFADRPVRCLFARDWKLPDGAPFLATWAVGWWLSCGASASHGEGRTPVPRWTARTARARGWEGSRVAWRDSQWRAATLAATRGKARHDGTMTSSPLPDVSPPVAWLPAARVHLPAGERLVVVCDGRLRDASVERWLGLEAGNAHELRLDGGGGQVVRVDLHERNHAHARLDAAAFAEVRREYLAQVRDDFAVVEDAITGNNLRVEDQVLNLTLVTEHTTSEWKALRTVKQLAARLLEADTPPVLLCAGAGTGKTWSVKQSMWQMATSLLQADGWLLPVVVPVQELARMPTGLSGTHLVLAYLRHKYSQHAEGRLLRMLEQAVEMRAAVLLIDGVDEAAALREVVEELVVRSLAPLGFRVLVTSRPEGVQKGLAAGWYDDFVRLNLSELTEEDQQRVLEQQDVDNEMYKHLCAFRDIRDGHDKLYEDSFSAEERRAVEALHCPNLIYPNPPVRDPSVRQLSTTGKLIARREGEPKSKTVQALSGGVFSPEGLRAIDAAIMSGEAVGRERTGKDADVCRKLADLAIKKKTQASALWPEIAARVDELYEVSEAAEEAFKKMLDKFKAEHREVEVDCGPLKDPVRVHEKAIDDYADECAEGELPESCVLDMLRARLVVSDAGLLTNVLDSLKKAAGEAGGGLEVVRLKNKFAALDPAHFRNLLVNARLQCSCGSVFVEVQLHHKQVLALNEERHCHDHYNFLRAKLRKNYTRELDAMLEQTMVTFAEVSKNPVLLSLLVVLLRDGDDALFRVRDRYSLYDEAMARVLARDVPPGEQPERVRAMLRRVACANHLREEGEGVRFFRDAEVREALTDEQWALWRRLLDRDEGGVPLVQTLSDARGGSGDGEYQFKHLSFQEALVAQAVVEGDEGVRETFWKDDDRAATRLRPFYRNTLVIGGARLCGALFQYRKHWDLSHVDDLSTYDVKALAALALAAPPEGATVTLESKKLDVATLLRAENVNLSDAGLVVKDGILLAYAMRMSCVLGNLGLQMNSIGAEGAAHIAEALKINKTLTSLDLYKNDIGAEGAAHIAEALKTNETLTSLGLDNNGIGAEGAAHIAEALKTNKTLTSLHLQYNDIGAEGAAHIAEALKTNKTLTSLNLGSNRIGAEGAAHIAEALKINKTLTSLDLQGNDIGAEGAAHIAEALKTNKTLTSLKLYNNRIGAEGAAHIAEALKTNKTLTSLHLYNNGIGAEGAAHIAEALKINKTLTSLDLHDNGIGAEGAAHIAEALTTNKTLTSLHLYNNGIGDEGAAHIAEALKTNKTLTSLDLHDSDIGAEGAAHIAEALKTNKTLTSLNLGGNGIGAEGAAHIAEALKTNKTLTSLDLRRNGIGAEGAAHIAEALKTNKTLTSLVLGGAGTLYL